MFDPHSPAFASPLSQPDYRRLWSGYVAGETGWTMLLTGLTGMLLGQGENFLATVALIPALVFLPSALFSLTAQLWSEVGDRRGLWLRGAATLALLALLLFILNANGWMDRNPAAVNAGAVLAGFALCLLPPVCHGILTSLDPAKNQGTFHQAGAWAGRLAGALLGGLLMEKLNIAWIFAASLPFFAWFWSTAHSWERVPAESSHHVERLFGSVTLLGRSLGHAQDLRRLLMRLFLIALVFAVSMAVLPVRMDLIQHSPLWLGLLLAAFAAGNLGAGQEMLRRLWERMEAEQLLAYATMGLAVVLALLAKVSHGAGLALLALMLGFAWQVAWSTLTRSLGELAPAWVRDQLISVAVSVMAAGLALGCVLWGQLAQLSHNNTLTLAIAAACVSLTLLLARWAPLGGDMRLDMRIKGRRQEKPMGDTEDGPVMVTIDYQVHPQSEHLFLLAMQRIRQVRMRAGAFRWSLYRSPEEETMLRELYLIGSWTEYERNLERMILADSEALEAAVRMHEGRHPRPETHYWVSESTSTAFYHRVRDWELKQPSLAEEEEPTPHPEPEPPPASTLASEPTPAWVPEEKEAITVVTTPAAEQSNPVETAKPPESKKITELDLPKEVKEEPAPKVSPLARIRESAGARPGVFAREAGKTLPLPEEPELFQDEDRRENR